MINRSAYLFSLLHPSRYRQGQLAVVLILLAVLLITSFVACYFSAKYWHWSHVLLVEMLFLSAVGYFLCAAEYTRIRQVYGKQLADAQKELDNTLPLLQALQRGTRDEAIIARLEGMEVPIVRDEAIEGRMVSSSEIERELAMVTRTRGRVWRDVQTTRLDPATMTITLTIAFPKPHGIEKDSIVYAFEQGPAPEVGQTGPQYIGEMRVLSVTGEQIAVTPTASLDERAATRLANTRAPWILYEIMPVDQHPNGILELFAGATEDQLRKWVPAASVEEYIRHGSARQADDDEFHISGHDATGKLIPPDKWDNNTVFRYRRQLRDYNYLFDELDKRLVELTADRNALTEDNRQLQQSDRSAQQVQAAYRAMQGKLKSDLQGVTRDRQAIEAHLNQVQTQLGNARQLLSATRADNVEMAESLLSR
jgi:hypothetical protein